MLILCLGSRGYPREFEHSQNCRNVPTNNALHNKGFNPSHHKWSRGSHHTKGSHDQFKRSSHMTDRSAQNDKNSQRG